MKPNTARSATPLRALVLEDEWPARNYLVELLEGTGLAEVVGAIASLEEARAVLAAAKNGVSVDVVFVDVQLMPDGEGAGLELVREMSRAPDAPFFVLATAHKDHALEAFELGVADYLLKPFTEERVEACLGRLQARRSSEVQPAPTPLRIVARRGRSLVFLDPSEVWAFEAADRLTSVHTAHGTFDVDLSLSAIEASLGRSFARVHRNWLVNASHIKRLDRDGSETTIFVGVGLAADDGKEPVDRAPGGPKNPGLTVPVARERAHGVREMLPLERNGRPPHVGALGPERVFARDERLRECGVGRRGRRGEALTMRLFSHACTMHVNERNLR